MTRLALLADLHFGSVPDGLADALHDELMRASPDACMIAGDLTLKARRAEFADARRWLDALPCERLVVPGNHDLPRHNILGRFLNPYSRFDDAIRADERDPLSLERCFAAGLNTTAPWQPHLKWQEGRVRRRDAAALSRLLAAAPADKLRIVVAHHPFAVVPDMARARPVRGAPTTLDLFRARRVDLVLSGHTHQSYVLPIEHARGRILAIGAPTALSDRRRGEANGYWLIDLAATDMQFTLRLRDGGGFIDGPRHAYPYRQFGPDGRTA